MLYQLKGKIKCIMHEIYNLQRSRYYYGMAYFYIFLVFF